LAKKQTKKQQQQKARRNNWVLIGAGVVLVAVAVAAFLAFRGGGGTPARRSARVTPVTTDAQAITVDVGDNYFKPAALRIKKGATITWQFKGKIPHTVTEDPGGEPTVFDSGTKTSGEFAHTFDLVGSFTYHCLIHHVMEGTVIVTE
jgi:plastocyanin